MTSPSEKIVLVVDDEPDVRFFLQMALEDAGFNVVTASNGQEALEKMNKVVPDFISCDLVMPKKAGIKFLHELRENDAWSKIPVVIVTAHARDELGSADLREILEGKDIPGQHSYLEKPVRAEDFVGLVKQELGIRDEHARESRQNVSEPSPQALRELIRSLLDSADADTLRNVISVLQPRRY